MSNHLVVTHGGLPNITIKQVLDNIKSVVNGIVSFTVSGIISDVSIRSGHVYFTLRDKENFISGIVWQSNQVTKKKITDNQTLSTQNMLCTGKIDFYAPGGRVSMIVSSITLSSSELQITQIDKTRQMLIDEHLCVGMESDNPQRNLPTKLENIAVITAINSAAWQDLKCTVQELGHSILVPYDCLVQGENSVAQISNKIMELRETHTVLCIVRGGGSSNDLISFSHEDVLRACIAFRAYSKNHIIICGVGHEIDHPLIELVVDHAMRTPTMVGKFLIESIEKERNQRRIVLHTVHRDLVNYYTTRYIQIQKMLQDMAENKNRHQLSTIKNAASNDAANMIHRVVRDIHHEIVSKLQNKANQLHIHMKILDAMKHEHNIKHIHASTCILTDMNSKPYSTHGVIGTELPTTYTNALLTIGGKRMKIKFKLVGDYESSDIVTTDEIKKIKHI